MHLVLEELQGAQLMHDARRSKVCNICCIKSCIDDCTSVAVGGASHVSTGSNKAVALHVTGLSTGFKPSSMDCCFAYNQCLQQATLARN